MSKLDVYKVLTCQQCGEELQYIFRSWNVNENLSEDDISHIAALNIGTVMPHDCECCKRITAHIAALRLIDNHYNRG